MKKCFLFDFYYPIWYTKNDKYNFFKKEEKMFYLIKGKIFMNGNEIIFLILTLAIGILGGYLADKKKVPAAFMIGALFAVAIFNIFTDRAFLPTSFIVYNVSFSRNRLYDFIFCNSPWRNNGHIIDSL